MGACLFLFFCKLGHGVLSSALLLGPRALCLLIQPSVHVWPSDPVTSPSSCLCVWSGACHLLRRCNPGLCALCLRKTDGSANRGLETGTQAPPPACQFQAPQNLCCSLLPWQLLGKTPGREGACQTPLEQQQGGTRKRVFPGQSASS